MFSTATTPQNVVPRPNVGAGGLQAPVFEKFAKNEMLPGNKNTDNFLLTGANSASSMEPSNGGAEKASATTDIADPLQLMMIESQLQHIAANAYKIDEMAKELDAQGSPEADKEAAYAREQAGLIRSTANEIKAEIAAAPVDRAGNKRIPATRVASLIGVLRHASHASDSEKAALTVAISEEYKKKEKEKEVASASKSTGSTVGGVKSYVRMAAPPVTVATTGYTGWHFSDFTHSVHPVSTQISHKFQTIWGDVSKTFASTGGSISSAFSEAVDYVGDLAPVKAARRFGGNVADSVRSFAHAPIAHAQRALSSAGEAIQETSIYVYKAADTYLVTPVASAAKASYHVVEAHVVTPVVTMAKVSYKAAGEMVDSVAALPARAKDAVVAGWHDTKKMVAGLLPGSHAAPAVIAKKEPIEKAAKVAAQELTLWDKAKQQASALALAVMPVSLSGHATSDFFRDLPKINSVFGQPPALS